MTYLVTNNKVIVYTFLSKMNIGYFQQWRTFVADENSTMLSSEKMVASH